MKDIGFLVYGLDSGYIYVNINKVAVSGEAGVWRMSIKDAIKVRV